jgi:hypothetical protein
VKRGSVAQPFVAWSRRVSEISSLEVSDEKEPGDVLILGGGKKGR